MGGRRQEGEKKARHVRCKKRVGVHCAPHAAAAWGDVTLGRARGTESGTSAGRHARFSPTKTVAQYNSVSGRARDCGGDKTVSARGGSGEREVLTTMKQTMLYTLRSRLSIEIPVHG